jgi:hypothetical protein
MAGEKIQRKGVGGLICWEHYVLMYESRKMKAVETISRMGKERIKENDGGGEFD